MGFTVFAGCLSDKSQGAETLKRICTKRVHILQLDVTKSEDILQARKTVQKGCAAPGKNELHTSWRKCLQVHLFTTVIMLVVRSPDAVWSYT